MNILLLGAAGRVGNAVTKIILSNSNQQLTILVRDKNKIQVEHERLQIVEGDIYDWPLLNQLSKRNYDVVINVAGADPLKPSTIVTDTAIAISGLFVFIEKPTRYIAVTTIAQMRKTAFGYLNVAFLKLTAVKHAIKDHQNALEVIKSSELDWCLVACPLIKDGLTRGKFKSSKLYHGGAKYIHPGDVAIAIVNEIDRRDSKKITGVWY